MKEKDILMLGRSNTGNSKFEFSSTDKRKLNISSRAAELMLNGDELDVKIGKLFDKYSNNLKNSSECLGNIKSAARNYSYVRNSKVANSYPLRTTKSSIKRNQKLACKYKRKNFWFIGLEKHLDKVGHILDCTVTSEKVLASRMMYYPTLDCYTVEEARNAIYEAVSGKKKDLSKIKGNSRKLVK